MWITAGTSDSRDYAEESEQVSDSQHFCPHCPVQIRARVPGLRAKAAMFVIERSRLMKHDYYTL
jgi:hypothetical protein